MTTVPPPNVALPQMPAAATAAPMVVIPQPPAPIAALPPGTVVEAVVLPPPATAPARAPATAATPSSTAPAPAPTVTLHTAIGDVTVRLPVPLPQNARIELEVVRAAPNQVTVRLVSVEGLATTQYLAQNRAAAEAPAAASPAAGRLPALGPQPLPPGQMWMPAGPAPFVQAGTVSAVVTLAPPMAETLPTTQSAPPAAAPPAGSATAVSSAAAALPPTSFAGLPLARGSELTLKIVGLQLPGAAVVSAPPNTLSTPASNIAPNAIPAVQTSPASPAIQATTLPQVAPAPTPQPGLVLPGPQGLPPAPPQPPALVQPAIPIASATATIIALANNIPVVAVGAHEMQINTRANLPIGTKIVFDVMAATAPRPGAPLPLPAAALPLSGPPGAYAGWPTLTESLTLLQRSDPLSAQHLAQAIPDGGPRTAAAVISFVQAMRTGDPRQWPGDASLRALERAGPRGMHLAGQLSAEVSELAARARDSGAEWRALPVPWSAQGEIERVALVTRREGENENEKASGRKGGGIRFLVNLDLSRLGPMQLDGMFKAETRAFDLVLRTKAALPEPMRMDLIGLFTQTNAAMGLAGGLTFQVTRKFADPLSGGTLPDKSGLWA